MAGGTAHILREFGITPKIDVQTGFYVAAITLFSWALWEASLWNHDARIVPNIVGYFGLAIIGISMINHTFRTPGRHDDDSARGKVMQSLHLDLSVRGPKMDPKTLAIRAGTYFAWLLFFLLSSALVGILFTVFLFVVGYMRIEGREPWKMTILCALSLFAFTGILFDELLALPWPQAAIFDVYVETKEVLLNQYNVWFLK